MIDTAIAKHLTTLELVTYDPDGADGDCFVGFMPSTPDAAVMIKLTGGLPQPSKEPDDRPTVQILVRGTRQDRQGALDWAVAILGALNCLDGVTLDEGGADEVYVVGLTAAQSAPIDIGKDDNDRHELSLNFDAYTHAPTLNRT